VSAAHFDANLAILRQTVLNLLHSKLCAIYSGTPCIYLLLYHTLCSEKTPTHIFFHISMSNE